MIWSGVSPLFFSLCHSLATFGNSFRKLLKEATFLLAQYGQLVPFATLLAIRARQVSLHAGHNHQAF
jgi:hypothetical protein